MSRLHLPHPHIAERFAAAFEHALHHPIRADDLTTSAAVSRWAEWQTPEQWEADQHHNKGENHA
ncbi:hypothetical protein [Nocardia sp. NPDC019302]|uniref:hypothetical protein n=1 Tax=Nocardia sp. NPDC019302 TaxID=3154592 RepID=UPI0033C13ACE